MSYFRRQAATYAEFRPDYPDELFRWAASIVKKREVAWDCGTGNGQAAIGLARYFQRVIATDVIPEQIAHARQHPRVKYDIAPAEASGLPARSVDLIMVCQALHWFDRLRFFAEAKRLLVPAGALVVTVYGDAHVAGDRALDAMLQTFSKQTMGPYWPVDRKLVDDLYAAIEFPFELLAAPAITLQKSWTLPQLAGYMRSWSSTTRYVEQHGSDPIVEVECLMQSRWGDGSAERLIQWPFRVYAAHFG